MNTPEQRASATTVQLSDLFAWQPYAGVLRRPRIANTAMAAGQHHSHLRGQGMEFDEVRMYQPGDDTARIDWRVTARTHKPHVKLFREERERPLLQCLDYRPDMFFATRGRLKAVQATHLAALLAWVGIARGDRLGGLLFSAETHREIRPARGKHGVLRWLQQCADHHCWSSPCRMPTSETDLETLLQRLCSLTKPGTTVMLFSDFHGLHESLLPHIHRLARHCECLLCHVYDPLECQLPDGSGSLTATDGRQRIRIELHSRQLRQQITQDFANRKTLLDELNHHPRLHVLHVSTGDAVLDTIVQAHLWI